jgi:hypothetical protein
MTHFFLFWLLSLSIDEGAATLRLQLQDLTKTRTRAVPQRSYGRSFQGAGPLSSMKVPRIG